MLGWIFGMTINGSGNPYHHVPITRGVLGIWADTYAWFEVWSTHPSNYQSFLPKPIHRPFFANFLLMNPSIYQNMTLKVIYLPFSQFLLLNPSIYQNFMLKPIHLPKFHTFLGNDPLIHLHRAYVSMKICEYPPGVKYSWNCSSWSGECISCKIVIFVTKMCSNFSHVLTIISLVTIISNFDFGPVYVLTYSMIHV